MRKAFHKGSNTSCRFHIRQHYEIYKNNCEKADIPVHHWAIPRPIWQKMEEEKVAKGSVMKKKQLELDFKAVTHPQEFTRVGTLHAVAKLIATNYQVSHQCCN